MLFWIFSGMFLTIVSPVWIPIVLDAVDAMRHKGVSSMVSGRGSVGIHPGERKAWDDGLEKIRDRKKL